MPSVGGDLCFQRCWKLSTPATASNAATISSTHARVVSTEPFISSHHRGIFRSALLNSSESTLRHRFDSSNQCSKRDLIHHPFQPSNHQLQSPHSIACALYTLSQSQSYFQLRRNQEFCGEQYPSFWTRPRIWKNSRQ